MAEDWEKTAKEFEEIYKKVGAVIVAGFIVALVLIGVGAIVWSRV